MPRKKKKREWTKKDFVSDLYRLMQRQLAKNPHLAVVYAKLDPDFAEVSKLIHDLLATAEGEEKNIINKIISFKEKAIVPLIDFLIRIKRLPKNP